VISCSGSDHLRTAGDTGHERDIAAVAAHRLHREGTLVRRGGGAQTVDRLERDVDRRVRADADVGAVEVVVDGGGDAHHREPLARERARAGLRPVAADHDQRVDAARGEVGECPRPPLDFPELGAARAAEDRAAVLDDAPDVARGQALQGARHQPGEAVAHAEHFPALGQRGAGHRAHRRIHSGSVAAARQDCDFFQAGHFKA